jgi:hypothetical protein
MRSYRKQDYESGRRRYTSRHLRRGLLVLARAAEALGTRELIDALHRAGAAKPAGRRGGDGQWWIMTDPGIPEDAQLPFGPELLREAVEYVRSRALRPPTPRRQARQRQRDSESSGC